MPESGVCAQSVNLSAPMPIGTELPTKSVRGPETKTVVPFDVIFAAIAESIRNAAGGPETLTTGLIPTWTVIAAIPAVVIPELQPTSRAATQSHFRRSNRRPIQATRTDHMLLSPGALDIEQH